MPTIRLPQTPGVQAAPYQGAAPADKTAQYRGQQALAAGIADVGGAMMEFAQRSKEIKDRADAIRVEQAIRAEEADFATWQETEPDETKWGDEANRRAATVADKVASYDLSNTVKREADLRLRTWGQDRAVQVRNQAERYANKRHDHVLIGQTEIAAHDGDKATVDALIDERVILGLLDPKLAPLVRDQYHKKADVQTATSHILDNPADALAKLRAQKDGKYTEFTDLDETQRRTLERQAAIGMHDLQKEAYADLQQRILANEPLTEHDIMETVGPNGLSPTEAKALIGQLRTSGNDPAVEQKWSEINRAITAYTATADEDHGQEAAIKRDILLAHLPQKWVEELNQRIDRKADPTARTKPTDHKETRAQKLLDTMLDNGDLGGFPGLPDQGAYRNRAVLSDALTVFLNSNPNASETEITDFLNGHSVVKQGRSTNAATTLDAWAKRRSD